NQMSGILDGTPVMIGHMLDALGAKGTGAVKHFTVTPKAPAFWTSWLADDDEAEAEGDWRYPWRASWRISASFDRAKAPTLPKRGVVPVGVATWDDTWGKNGVVDAEDIPPAALALTFFAKNATIAKVASRTLEESFAAGPEQLQLSRSPGPGGLFFAVVTTKKKKVEAAAARALDARRRVREVGAATHWRDAAMLASRRT
ncbi:MAG: hypothetical protein WKG00_21990, partial [Polyangiaceae bacterium]